MAVWLLVKYVIYWMWHRGWFYWHMVDGDNAVGLGFGFLSLIWISCFMFCANYRDKWIVSLSPRLLEYTCSSDSRTSSKAVMPNSFFCLFFGFAIMEGTGVFVWKCKAFPAPQIKRLSALSKPMAYNKHEQIMSSPWGDIVFQFELLPKLSIMIRAHTHTHKKWLPHSPGFPWLLLF